MADGLVRAHKMVDEHICRADVHYVRLANHPAVLDNCCFLMRSLQHVALYRHARTGRWQGGVE